MSKRNYDPTSKTTFSIRHSVRKSVSFVLLIALLVTAGLQFFSPPQPAKADVVAGFTEYFIPGAADDIFSILTDLSSFSGSTFTNVITMPITTPNLTVYYDHWENGYLTGAAGDETYTGYAVGSVLTFKSTAIPNPRGTTLAACSGSTNPAGTTSNCYDGMDRIFVVGGAVSIAQVYWPTGTGTVYANAWEVYPVNAWETSYKMPVGENLYTTNTTSYADFDCVYALVEAKEDGTVVTFDNTRTSAPGSGNCGNSWWQDGSVTLAKGKTYYRGGVNSASTITATKPVEVQFIVGREDSSYDSRSHTLVPSGQWDKEYYSPVPGYSGTDVNIYLYNPTGAVLAVTYQDSSGTSTCNVPANGTLSIRACLGRFVANGSAVKLSAASNFLAIGEYDSGSSARNWGFSIIPKRSLNTEYFLPWAPGTSDVPPTNNGSPVFVTPTVNGQVIYVDYSPITTPPTTEATYTLNLLQVQKIRDSDNDNTGMHVWSDYPFAMTWGEDAQYASSSNPYIDAGYTILPPNPEWVNIALTVNKSANPEVISKLVGEVVEFTIDVKAGLLPIDNIFIEDYLPPYFAYQAGTTNITWPSGSYTTNPTITGAAATGYTLHWGVAPNNIGDLAAGQTMTLKFKAVTVTGFNADSSVNNTSATGYWGNIPLTATAQATVTAGQPGHLIVIKDAAPDSAQDFPFTLINQAKPGDPTNFVLDDDADGTNSNTINFGLKPGNYTLTETAVDGWYLLNTACTSSLGGNPLPANIPLVAGETVTCKYTNVMNDWGDLPDTYKTLLTTNGPRHAVFPDTTGDGLPDSFGGKPAIWMGSIFQDPDGVPIYGPGKIDLELNGIPGPGATGDDLNAALNDEDGSRFSVLLDTAGQGTIDVRFNSSNPDQSGAGCLAIWFDWNSDGVFDITNAPADPYIKSYVTWTSANLTQSFNFTFPSVSLPVTINYRARLFDLDASACAALDMTTAAYGQAVNGEIEDYAFDTTPTALSVSEPSAATVDQSIEVSWESYSEIYIIGYSLYRSSSVDSTEKLVYSVEAANRGNPWGSAYKFLDTDIKPDVIYTYWLDVQNKDGSITRLGPSIASLAGAPIRVYLPAVQR